MLFRNVNLFICEGGNLDKSDSDRLASVLTSVGCNNWWPVNERLSYRHKLLQGCPVFKEYIFLLYREMVCVGAI